MFNESIFPEVKRITGTLVSHNTRYSLPPVAQQADLQSSQRLFVPSSATASVDTKITSLQPPPLLNNHRPLTELPLLPIPQQTAHRPGAFAPLATRLTFEDCLQSFST
eukprot:3404396-Pleurochrysis_carterae.AAC.3